MRKFLALTLCLVLSSPFFIAHATPSEAAFLRNVAKQYILAQFKGKLSDDERVIVEPAKLDPNRNYKGKCPGYLTAQLQGNKIRRTSIVRIHCADPKNTYTVNIPVEITKQVRALVLKRNLSKGDIIEASDLHSSFIDSKLSGNGNIGSLQALIGSRLKQNVSAGQQLRERQICAVCKGDRVIIEAKTKGLSIKTSAVALEDGNTNEQVKVKNLKSGRTVFAIVAAPGLVQIFI